MVPLWLPWVILLVLLGAVVLKPESSLRTSGPIAIVLVVASWLTVDHVWVTQDELTAATADAAAAVDGMLAGVSGDRLRLEIEDRVGHPVTIETNGRDAGGADDTYTTSYVVRLEGGGDHPLTCVTINDRPVNKELALRVASVSSSAGACD